MSEITTPVLDMQELQIKANEAAMKGAISVINDFYNSYDSPYKKAIQEHMNGKGTSFAFEVPDIIAVLNDSITKEIDTLANAAIAKTFIPLVKDFLMRAPASILFSDILKKFIEEQGNNDYYDYSVQVEKHSSYDWLSVVISCGKETYNLTLHQKWECKKEEQKKYKILGLPYTDSKYHKTMKLQVDGGATLEMPFTTDILKDRFISYVANLVMSGSEITIDTTDFEDDMFEHCHC